MYASRERNTHGCPRLRLAASRVPTHAHGCPRLAASRVPTQVDLTLPYLTWKVLPIHGTCHTRHLPYMAPTRKVLGMGRDGFYQLSKVEQMRIKQDVGLCART